MGKDRPDRCDLGVAELSPTEWWVCDRMIANGDPLASLGFVRRVGDFFEVTNLGRLREKTYFSSFERAAASLAAPKVLT